MYMDRNAFQIQWEHWSRFNPDVIYACFLSMGTQEKAWSHSLATLLGYEI